MLTIQTNANEVSNFFTCQSAKKDLIEIVDAIENTHFRYKKDILRGEVARLNHVFMDNNCTYAPRTLDEAIKGAFDGK
jgi:hypothetical protein